MKPGNILRMIALLINVPTYSVSSLQQPKQGKKYWDILFPGLTIWWYQSFYFPYHSLIDPYDLIEILSLCFKVISIDQNSKDNLINIILSFLYVFTHNLKEFVELKALF